MARHVPTGGWYRQGAVKDRSQVQNPRDDQWTKRDTESGPFINQKSNGAPFKGVRSER